jgi:hypothetical protein
MGSGIVVASAWRHGVPALAAAVLITLCFGPRSIRAAECDPHCDRRVHRSEYGDPRCESRRIGERLDRVETRCDLREPRRKANQQTPSTAPPSRPAAVPPSGQVPVIGAGGHGRQQPRSVDRDVGFDDAFTTQGNGPAGGGASGANANAGAGANPGGAAAAAAEARRTPPGRAR